ncbi:hypothetical protein PCK2_000671 [Pneumocystis canis]|nr:hypothetical protein PCK2_000671 [Pneumocystis canis]
MDKKEISITELVHKFKLNGKFDFLRKEILTIYKNSDRGKIAIIINNIIDKSNIYNNARELMNDAVFMNKEFREKVNIIMQGIKNDLEENPEKMEKNNNIR